MKRAVFAAVAGLAAALVVVPSAAAIDDVNTQRLRNGVTWPGHPRAHARLPARRPTRTAATAPPPLPATRPRSPMSSAASRARATRRSGTSSTSPPGSRTAPPSSSARVQTRRIRKPDRLRACPSSPAPATSPRRCSPRTTSRSRRRACPARVRAAASARTGPPATGRSPDGSRCPARHLPVRAEDPAGQGPGRRRRADLQRRLPGPGGAVRDHGPPFIGIPVAMTSSAVGVALYAAVQQGPVNVTIVRRRHHGGDHAVQPDRRHGGRRPRAHDRGRRPPRQRRGGSGHQRQRVGLQHPDRARRGDRRVAWLSRATASASRGGAPRNPAWSARTPTCATCSSRARSTTSKPT